ncbi:ThuA domain-containing protein [Rubellicoccus peritrichatus]|uniref:ThuA domain-containing protein n=1 Tax=Rubellicoccus peritrichatus TaxID=3080537 RepID=A0AAQ3L7Q2_9BACT|nr:ThuA domain-containing protein [Puniceicoccus sp. CR14]WOO40197.1 ThuA domain-containing protein [Puniceicoccus sp. CR14]
MSQLIAEIDWKPTFNDKPVPADQQESIRKAVPQEPIVEPDEDRKVLVFSATSGFRHGSIPTGKLALELMGESTGAYEAVVSDDPANFEPDALDEFDAVILLNPTQNFFMPNNKQKGEFSKEEWQQLQQRHKRLVDNLIKYLNDGGGIVGIHAATDACYGHAEYGEAMGGYFAGHPWGGGNNVTIVVEDPDHAINKAAFDGLEDFQLREEIYQFSEKPYSRNNLRILLNLDPERSDPVGGKKRMDDDYAVSWVHQVGDGRLFYSSIGHNHHIYWNPMILKHYLAGIQFATGDLEADTTPSGNPKPKIWKPLSAWKGLPNWSEENGTNAFKVNRGIIAYNLQNAKANAFLASNQEYGNFILEFQVKAKTPRSGVQIRAETKNYGMNKRINGYAIKSGDNFSKDRWNSYRIEAKGSTIQTWLNGKLIDETNKISHAKGLICLQAEHNGKPGGAIEWRSIRINVLD